jgi:non-ribosomal peptide synthetase component F
MARNPLFQVAFLIEEPLPVRPLGGAAAEVRRVETGTAKFDLTLSILPGEDGFTSLLEYDASRFDPATADRLLGHWRTLLEGIAVDPEARLSALPLLTAGEAEQVRAWSGTVADLPPGAGVHELFEAEVRGAPGAVALETGDLRLTYAELEARANRLARRLRRLGVGLETPVGLFLDRSAALVVAMLGVLKAGGTYAPLDPSYPQERLAFLLEDTGTAVLVGAAETGVAAWTGPAVLLDGDGGMARRRARSPCRRSPGRRTWPT